MLQKKKPHPRAGLYYPRLTRCDDARLGHRLRAIAVAGRVIADLGDKARVVATRRPAAGAAFSGAANVLQLPDSLDTGALRPSGRAWQRVSHGGLQACVRECSNTVVGVFLRYLYIIFSEIPRGLRSRSSVCRWLSIALVCGGKNM